MNRLFANQPQRQTRTAEISVPAVIVGGTLNSLGVIRSLSIAGIPVFLLNDTRLCHAGWSRHCQFYRIPSLDGPGLIDALAILGARLGCKPVLILTSDRSVLAVSERRSVIEPLYHISLPSIETVRALADKSSFQRLAEKRGFPVPRAVTIAGTDDLERLDALEPPLVLKPAEKIDALSGKVKRAVRVENSAEGRREARNMLAHLRRIIVQEWIDGPDHDIFFTLFYCDRNGELVGAFAGRKLVCTPPAVGITAVCVAAPAEANDLIVETRRFIEAFRYRGLGSVEFKRDARTRRFVIVEPTVGRTDWQEEIATLCGINLPLLAYWTELGLSCGDRDSVSAAYADSFVPTIWRSSMGFRAPRDLLPREFRVIDGFFRWSDPLPGIYYYGYERFVRRIWRVGRRLIIRAGNALQSRLSRRHIEFFSPPDSNAGRGSPRRASRRT